jgi:hypothetical protein
MGAQPERRKARSVVFYTVVLTSDEPAKQVLRPDPNRVIAYVQAGGANVVLTTNRADAQSRQNTGDTGLAQPNGALLPYGNTSPTPLETTSEVWAATPTYPAQVSVVAVYEAG